jgi:hypothetical protein
MAHMIFAVVVAVGYLTFRLPAAAADVAAWWRRDQRWQLLGLPVSQRRAYLMSG